MRLSWVLTRPNSTAATLFPKSRVRSALTTYVLSCYLREDQPSALGDWISAPTMCCHCPSTRTNCWRGCVRKYPDRCWSGLFLLLPAHPGTKYPSLCCDQSIEDWRFDGTKVDGALASSP